MGSTSIERRIRAISESEIVVAGTVEEFRPKFERPILFVAMAKSASSFLSHAIPQGLGMPYIEHIAGGAWPNFLLNQHLVERVANLRCFGYHHIPAHPINLAMISDFFDRMVVHVRDPRQAVLSHLRNMWRHQRVGQGFLESPLFLPNGFFDRPSSSQLDYMIDHSLPEFVSWTEGWLDADQNPGFTSKILFTSYEEFVQDKVALIKRFLAFHDMSHQQFSFDIEIEPEKDQYLYNSSETVDEWKSVMSTEQKERATRAIPEHLCKKFGWRQ